MKAFEANELGWAIDDLARDQSQWSQATFGTDAERGPVGALKRLEKEAREAQAAPADREEYADCLPLILDASRRAGMTPMELIRAAQAKMVKNKARQWPKTTGDVRTEHIKEAA